MRPNPQLSAREDQVLQLLAAGLTPTHVARRLSLSVKTVSTYRQRILAKTHATTTAELMQGVTIARAIQWVEATFGPLTAAQHADLRRIYRPAAIAGDRVTVVHR